MPGRPSPKSSRISFWKDRLRIALHIRKPSILARMESLPFSKKLEFLLDRTRRETRRYRAEPHRDLPAP